MHRAFMFCVVLMICSAWMPAQEGYPQSGASKSATQGQSEDHGGTSQTSQSSSQPAGPGQADGSEGNPQSSGQLGADRTIRGCLQSSGTEYSLVADNGKAYQLTGDTAKLKDHVGHEVEITGKTSLKTSSMTQQGAASSAREQRAIEVQSMKHIAGTCQSRAQ